MTNAAHILVTKECMMAVHQGDFGYLREGEDENDEEWRKLSKPPRCEMSVLDYYITINLDPNFIFGMININI